MPGKKQQQKHKEPEDKVLDFKEKGNQAFQKEKYEESIKFYTRAIECNGKHPLIHTLFANRSAAQEAHHNYVEALKDADSVIFLRPTWSKGHLRRAIALEGMMKWQESLSSYQKSAELDATDEVTQAGVKRVMEHTSKSEGKFAKNQDKFEQMCEWMIKSGCKFPQLMLKSYGENYRGVHAAKRIANDTQILYVPLSALMTSDVAKDSLIGRRVIACGLGGQSSHTFLACYILQEKKNPTSFWAPYINILPTSYKDMPIFYTEEQLKELEASYCRQRVRERIDDMKKDYDVLCSKLTDFKTFCTYDEFEWARMAVLTRIFGFTVHGHKTDGMVPLADMLNHYVPRQTSWNFDDKQDGFTITTLKTMAKEEQIYDSYGRKCNTQLFANYGFTLPDNDSDRCSIVIGITMTDPLLRIKLETLRYPMRRFIVMHDYYEPDTVEMFSFARFAAAENTEIMVMQEGKEFKTENIPPITARNEIAVLRMIKESCEKALKMFPTSLEDDNKLYANKEAWEKMPLAKRNCINVRRGEKRVLHSFMTLADTCMEILELEWSEVKRRIQQLNLREPTKYMFNYANAVIIPLKNPRSNSQH